MKMKYTIGMDIGGTKISAGLVDESRVIRKIVMSKIKRKSKDWITNKIISIIKELVKNKEIEGIGIGVPGSLDLKAGKILVSPNLPYLNGVNIKRIIESKLGIKTKIDNDANCMAFGESIIRKVKNLVCLTLGTGVGGGIVLNGKIYHGKGSAGEIGHTSIVTNGRKCKCGNYGCLEEYVGERSFKREVSLIFGKKLNPKEIERLAKKGNKKALKIYTIIGKYLGVGLANITHILHPNLIIIGGGIAKSGNLLLEPAEKEMKKRIFISPPKIKLAKPNSSILGAAWLALK